MMFLYHYFDESVGPFVSLSDLPVDQAQAVLETIKQTKPGSQSAQRQDTYVEYRRHCEQIIRTEFKRKGGLVKRPTPHYMVVEHSPWLSTWFEHSACIKIPIEEFERNTISFTYGDSMPTFSPKVNDGKEYRHTLYTYDEILTIIEKYGLPQTWNNDGQYGPERYIEAHIWNDEPVNKYRDGSLPRI
ncbi:hypothetical protein KDC22_01660 [Paenibacillus tritici]|uniref:hypothetical protein n=1 Tax=Paenibacillus tritici TaxID=1873425 RepID=UPI001BA6B64C|nr:hypothetical protein [Paenibacillus tritici]QUL55315.1 hypothetical protein KDC22_01660 [Paenibacillus tritici]